jgi:hypothetical protein
VSCFDTSWQEAAPRGRDITTSRTLRHMVSLESSWQGFYTTPACSQLSPFHQPTATTTTCTLPTRSQDPPYNFTPPHSHNTHKRNFNMGCCFSSPIDAPPAVVDNSSEFLNPRPL